MLLLALVLLLVQAVSYVSRRRLDAADFDADAVDEEGAAQQQQLCGGPVVPTPMHAMRALDNLLRGLWHIFSWVVPAAGNRMRPHPEP